MFFAKHFRPFAKRPGLDEKQNVTTSPLVHGIAMVKDSFEVQVIASVPRDRASDRFQKVINEQEQGINSEAVTNDSDSSTSETRRRRNLENVQKLLDIFRGMNPQI